VDRARLQITFDGLAARSRAFPFGYAPQEHAGDMNQEARKSSMADMITGPVPQRSSAEALLRDGAAIVGAGGGIHRGKAFGARGGPSRAKIQAF
jgi:hypothetical protein